MSSQKSPKTTMTNCLILYVKKVGEVGMDREKVIAWLADEELYYREHGNAHNSLMACNALELLKEQEKAKVVFGRCKDGSFATECGHCGMYLDKAYSKCPKCNKELDWNSNQD